MVCEDTLEILYLCGCNLVNYNRSNNIIIRLVGTVDL